MALNYLKLKPNFLQFLHKGGGAGGGVHKSFNRIEPTSPFLRSCLSLRRRQRHNKVYFSYLTVLLEDPLLQGDKVIINQLEVNIIE